MDEKNNAPSILKRMYVVFAEILSFILVAVITLVGVGISLELVCAKGVLSFVGVATLIATSIASRPILYGLRRLLGLDPWPESDGSDIYYQDESSRP